MSLASIGEFGLIEQIRKWTDSVNHPLISIGDDAAVFSPKEGWDIVCSVDALIEGVHFDRQYVPMRSLGWKAISVNFSDLAAVGAVPRYALVTLALPDSWSVEELEDLYLGMGKCCQTFNSCIIGGDTTGSKKDGFISVTVLGETKKNKAILRSGARVGDYLFCTGQLGGAKAGFEMLCQETPRKEYNRALSKFLEPWPRVTEARWLIQNVHVSSMIDISDGLASEIHHICRESGVGCLVDEDRIPILPEAAEWFASFNLSGIKEVLYSGEEYELLFTVRTDNPETVIQQANKNQIELACIGQILPQNEGVHMRSARGIVVMQNRGWNHFQ